MNSNKLLLIFSCFLLLLVVIFIFNRSKSSRYEYISTDNELLMNNIRCTPEVVRSYEKVKDVYGRKNTLIFRYISASCSSCTDSHLEEILAFQEETGKDNVWIYPAYPNDRKSRIVLNSDLAKFNYRNIPADSLLIPTIDGEEKSYFAWINNEGDIGMIFFPDRLRIQQTRMYLQEVKKLLTTVKER